MASGIKFTAYKDGGALYPYGEFGGAQLERIPNRPKLVTVEVKQPRNPKHLALYWVILARVAENDPDFIDAEDVDWWVKVKLGMYKEFKDYDGRILIRPKSISVESMDQIHFKSFFDRAVYLLSQRAGVSVEELLNG